jgi:hypothetical protein
MAVDAVVSTEPFSQTRLADIVATEVNNMTIAPGLKVLNARTADSSKIRPYWLILDRQSLQVLAIQLDDVEGESNVLFT